MLKKIIAVVLTVFLLPFPFTGSWDILGKFSPYFNNNAVTPYFFISLACGLLSAGVMFYLTNKQLPKSLLYAGAFLFIIGISMSSVMGLVAAPDFSPSMLQHPEREQYRYALLFLNAILFGGAFFLLIHHQWRTTSIHRWIILLFIPAFIELIWESQHHFFLSGHLQHWINEGKNAVDFMEHYTPETVFRLAGFARCLQYAVFSWMVLILLKGSFLKKWISIIIIVFCSIGVGTGIAVMYLGYASFAKLQVLVLFVIPAGPFAMLYWTGLGLLTKKSSLNSTL